jgi:hypothetical protein
MTTTRQSPSCPTPPPYTQSSTIRINTALQVRHSISASISSLSLSSLAPAPRKTAPPFNTQAPLPAFPTYGIVPRAPRFPLCPRDSGRHGSTWNIRFHRPGIRPSTHNEPSPSVGADRPRPKEPKVDPALGRDALPIIGHVSANTGQGIFC